MSAHTPHEETHTPTPPTTPTDAAALPTDANSHADTQTPTNGVRGPQNGTQGRGHPVVIVDKLNELDWLREVIARAEVAETLRPLGGYNLEAVSAMFDAAGDIPRLLGALEGVLALADDAERKGKNFGRVRGFELVATDHIKMAHRIRAAVVAALGEGK